MRIFLIFLAILVAPLGPTATSVWAQQPTTGPVSGWVEIHQPDLKSSDQTTGLSGGMHFLLIDKQVNIPSQEIYRHFVIRVLNSEAVQSQSNISMDYDPSFQTLQIHSLRIHRAGRVIDNLATHQIQTIQREEGMDRHLFDGSLTAYIQQENVRVGDVIDYAYTIQGFNPIHDGEYFDDFYQSWFMPMREIRLRLLADPQSPPVFTSLNTAQKAERSTRGSLAQYDWVLRDVPGLVLPDNTPPWYDPFPRVQISGFASWPEVVAWALPHYTLEASEVQAVSTAARDLMPGPNLETKILQAIRFVQDEVRYLGLEGGLGAYSPNRPDVVLQRRFGDCKDKSLLLCALLRGLGLEAQPVLVNSYLQDQMTDKGPSPLAFNHCIATFNHQGQPYFVDPTQTNQGGDLAHMAPPDFRYGLVLAPGKSDLTPIPAPSPSQVDAVYNFQMGAIGEPAKLELVTTYRGFLADYQRQNVQNFSLEEIGRNSLDFLSENYGGIALDKPMRVTDDTRNTENVLIFTENFHIQDMWKKAEEDSLFSYAEFFPLEIRDQINLPSSAARQAPFHLGLLLDLTVKYKVAMPEPWPVEGDPVEILGPGFTYNSGIGASGRNVDFFYRYQRHLEYIEGSQLAEFNAGSDRIWSDLAMYISWNGILETFSFSWFSAGLAFLSLLLGWQIFRVLNRRYDPAAKALVVQPRKIGGWLILPMLGLFFTPLRMGWDMFGDPIYFNHSTWIQVLQSNDYSAFSAWGALIGVEIVANLVLMAGFIFLIFLFLKKRTSFPLLFILINFAHIFFLAADTVAAAFLFSSLDDSSGQLEEWGDFLRSIFYLWIWGSYLMRSERAKETFVVRRDGSWAKPPADVADPDVPEIHEVPAGPDDQISPVPGLLRKIRDQHPELEANLTGEEPGQRPSLIFPVQPGVPHSLYMDLVQDQVLQLSIGPILWSWNPSSQLSVQEEFSDTVLGLLTGRYRLVTGKKNGEVMKARLERLDQERWISVRKWARGRMTSGRGLQEEIVTWTAGNP